MTPAFGGATGAAGDDAAVLRRCLDLAERAIGVSDPNPRVGCVIAAPDGRRLEGHTHAAGGAHAEADALAQAARAGVDLRGATVWISLEPCAHHGRTPPCADALVAAGVARAVVATLDPNPRVAGRGVERLREAGVRVDVVDDAALAARSRWLNVGFFSRMLRGRPWVRCKVAQSLDGRIALADGTSRWITGADARRDGHAWRRRAGAVLSGRGTVAADDPRLDVRLVETAVQPLRVVVASGFDVAAGAATLAPPGRAIVVGTRNDPSARARRAALHAAGASTHEMTPSPAATPSDAAGPEDGTVDLDALVRWLAVEHEVNELHVEAGGRLNGALLSAGLVDELLVYVAATVIGPGRGGFETAALATLPTSADFAFVEAAPVGADLRLRAVRRTAAAAVGL